MEPRYLGPLFLVRDSGHLLIIKPTVSLSPLVRLLGVSDPRHGVWRGWNVHN